MINNFVWSINTLWWWERLTEWQISQPQNHHKERMLVSNLEPSNLEPSNLGPSTLLGKSSFVWAGNLLMQMVRGQPGWRREGWSERLFPTWRWACLFRLRPLINHCFQTHLIKFWKLNHSFDWITRPYGFVYLCLWDGRLCYPHGVHGPSFHFSHSNVGVVSPPQHQWCPPLLDSQFSDWLLSERSEAFLLLFLWDEVSCGHHW